MRLHKYYVSHSDVKTRLIKWNKTTYQTCIQEIENFYGILKLQRHAFQLATVHYILKCPHEIENIEKFSFLIQHSQNLLHTLIEPHFPEPFFHFYFFIHNYVQCIHLMPLPNPHLIDIHIYKCNSVPIGGHCYCCCIK